MRIPAFFLLAASFGGGVWAQTSTVTCATTAVPPTVRAEGIAERTGDILISCSGGAPSGQVSGNFIVYLNTQITNKLLSNGSLDATLTVSAGTGTPATYNAMPYLPNAVAFNGVTFPLTPQGTAEMRIVNLRGNATAISANPFPNQTATVVAALSFTGQGLTFATSQATVAYVQTGLFATQAGTLVCDQNGSPLPSTINVANLLATSATGVTRVTEGFASAFTQLSDPTNLRADTGTRVIFTYSGFTAGARLFVPDVIAGSDATVPTSAGNLGSAASGGAYTPGQNQLLFARVLGADANGAGGSPMLLLPSTPVTFNTASEVTLLNGQGVVVYEVIDADPKAVESAQFPVFLGLAPNSGASGTATSMTLSLAPVAIIMTQQAGAPVPRFVAGTPGSDCSLLNDCSAAYFPHLKVTTTLLTLTAAPGGSATGYIPVNNSGTGAMGWTARATTTGGAAWLKLSPIAGVNSNTVRVDASAADLAAGQQYQGSVTIDAGTAGRYSVPVLFTVGTVMPTVKAITNAADSSVTPVVPGSFATLWGSGFAGGNVTVTFDGVPGKVSYVGAGQINVLVPDTLAGKTSTQVVVAVDGKAGQAFALPLAVAAPAIFPNAVLNQDWSVNGASSPAAVGSVIQIFATGLSGVITAKVHDRTITAPDFAGTAPGFPGLQQVNVRVPADLPAMQTYVYVCAGPTGSQQTCSPAVMLWIK